MVEIIGKMRYNKTTKRKKEWVNYAKSWNPCGSKRERERERERELYFSEIKDSLFSLAYFTLDSDKPIKM